MTANFGINYKISETFYLQPFIGIGASLEMMKTGDEKIFLNGTPVREGNTSKIYIDPCLTIGARAPIFIRGYIVAPFVQAYQYIGKIDEDNYDTGFLILFGVETSL